MGENMLPAMAAATKFVRWKLDIPEVMVKIVFFGFFDNSWKFDNQQFVKFQIQKVLHINVLRYLIIKVFY